MKPEFFTRGPRKPTRTVLRRPGVTIGMTKVDEELMDRIRRARLRLGLEVRWHVTEAEEGDNRR